MRIDELDINKALKAVDIASIAVKHALYENEYPIADAYFCTIRQYLKMLKDQMSQSIKIDGLELEIQALNPNHFKGEIE